MSESSNLQFTAKDFEMLNDALKVYLKVNISRQATTEKLESLISNRFGINFNDVQKEPQINLTELSEDITVLNYKLLQLKKSQTTNTQASNSCP